MRPETDLEKMQKYQTKIIANSKAINLLKEVFEDKAFPEYALSLLKKMKDDQNKQFRELKELCDITVKKIDKEMEKLKNYDKNWKVEN